MSFMVADCWNAAISGVGVSLAALDPHRRVRSAAAAVNELTGRFHGLKPRAVQAAGEHVEDALLQPLHGCWRNGREVGPGYELVEAVRQSLRIGGHLGF